MRYLTINTDASFCRYTKAGGYAFWVKCDSFTSKKSNWLKDDAENPTDAELKAIANCLTYLLVNLKHLPTANIIIINTDCKPAIRQLETPYKDLPLSISNLIKRLMVKTGASNIEFRHVKAHTLNNDKRSWVNEWCDTNAKEWMRKKRKQKYKEDKK